MKEYFPFWESLSQEQKELLAGRMVKRRFAKGAFLHRGTEECTGLLAVTEGQLRAYTLSEEGKELTLYRLFAGDVCLLSAACALGGMQLDVLVSAEQDSVVVQIPADIYKKLMEDAAPVANYTNHLMASRFSDVMWLLDQVLNKKLDSRLAALLLEEEELSGGEALSLTHEQLANHLGSVREVVTRMLRYFQKEGLVELGRGNIRLLNKEKLRRLAFASLRDGM